MDWDIRYLSLGLGGSFSLCNTELEKQVWKVLAKKDCEAIFTSRKPTHCERVIMAKYGIHVE